MRRLALALLVVAAGASAQPREARVHDPVMVEADGHHYVFATGPGVRVWRSENLDEWEPLGSALAEVPAWAEDIVPGFDGRLWAPEVVERDGTYYLYYSVSSLGRNASAIGVATSPTLDPDDPDYGWGRPGRRRGVRPRPGPLERHRPGRGVRRRRDALARVRLVLGRPQGGPARRHADPAG